MKVILSELMYVLCGIVCILTGFRGLKNEKNKITTFLFWNILAITFIFGKYIPYEYTGIPVSYTHLTLPTTPYV